MRHISQPPVGVGPDDRCLPAAGLGAEGAPLSMETGITYCGSVNTAVAESEQQEKEELNMNSSSSMAVAVHGKAGKAVAVAVSRNNNISNK